MSLVAHAQQPAMPLIAYLSPSSSAIPQDRLRALRQGLKEAGYVDGENVAITYRFAEGKNDQLPAIAGELVRGQIAVIVVGGNAAAFAGKAATTMIPFVFIVGEGPVQPRSDWNSCVNSCPHSLVLLCSSIRPMHRLRSPRCATLKPLLVR